MAERPKKTPAPPRGTILSDTGAEIATPKDSLGDLNLPPGVQALIETRINAAVDQLRADNQAELNRLAEEKVGWWRKAVKVLSAAVTILAFLSGWVFWYVSPERAQGYVDEYVATKVAQPAMKKALSEAAQKTATEYVDGKIKALDAKADSLESRISGALREYSQSADDQMKSLDAKAGVLEEKISKIGNEVGEKQAILSIEQSALKDSLMLMKLNVASKEGNLEAYEKLRSIASKKGIMEADAAMYLRDVEYFFDVDRVSGIGTIVFNLKTKERIRFGADEAIKSLQSSEDAEREAAANALSEFDTSSCIQAIIQALEKETNLRVIARLTRTLVLRTDATVRPLERGLALIWWQANRGTFKEQFPIDKYDRVASIFAMPDRSPGEVGFTWVLDKSSAVAILPDLKEIVRIEPYSSISRLFLVIACLSVGDFLEADKQVYIFNKLEPDSRYLPLAKAFVAARHGNRSDAIVSLNETIKRSKAVGMYAMEFAMFKDYTKKDGVQWPVIE